ncbi:MAG: type IV pilus assembly protein PilM [Candidatus Omnitrophota bacterium]
MIKIPFISLSKTKNRVGLDIGTSSVKVLALSAQKSGCYQLDYFSIQPFEGERSRDKIVQAIKQAMGTSNIKKVVISVAGQSVVVRQVLFPKMSEDELKSAIRYEAEKHIPFNIDEVYLDAQIVDEKTGDNKIKVLIVAAKKELIDERLTYLTEAGLEVEAIDCDSIAITNAFIFNNAGLGKEKTLALINIGASMTNVCILKDEMLNFVRDTPIGAENLENLDTQIRLSFDYYENQFGKGIDGIYLSGGGSRQAGLSERLSQAFGIESSVWDPTKNLTISPNISKESLKDVSNQLAVCLGLAMRQRIQ